MKKYLASAACLLACTVAVPAMADLTFVNNRAESVTITSTNTTVNALIRLVIPNGVLNVNQHKVVPGSWDGIYKLGIHSIPLTVTDASGKADSVTVALDAPKPNEAQVTTLDDAAMPIKINGTLASSGMVLEKDATVSIEK